MITMYLSIMEQISVKRIGNEIKGFKDENNDNKFIKALPSQEDMKIWYFLVIGCENSEFEDGFYLGKLLLPEKYPWKPLDIEMITESGRFRTGKKLCLSNTGYHPDDWKITWNIKNSLIGLQSIMLDPVEENQVNHIETSIEYKKKCARESIDYNKTYYPEVWKLFEDFANRYIKDKESATKA